jgi:hypothetical protein
MPTPVLHTYLQNFTTDALGQIAVTGVLSLTSGFERVNLQIVQYPSAVPNLNVQVNMGLIGTTTLSHPVDTFPLGVGGSPSIHSYGVMGPNLSVLIHGGPPHTAVSLQAWLYLH